jgi:hypothetical protein
LDCASARLPRYSAKKIYLDLIKAGHTGWPVSVVVEEPSVENVEEALRKGPYGLCVYVRS